jgi:hypothetical protein
MKQMRRRERVGALDKKSGADAAGIEVSNSLGRSARDEI